MSQDRTAPRVPRRSALLAGFGAAAGLASLGPGSLGFGRALAQPAPGQADAFTVLASDRRFSTWVSMVQQAGIAPYARGATPFTVLVPTDRVFSDLPQVRQELLPQSSEDFPDASNLIRFIRSHVLYGLHAPESFQGRRQTFQSVAGSPLTVDGTGAQITATWTSVGGRTGTAALGQAPLRASNALIYPVDRVELG